MRSIGWVSVLGAAAALCVGCANQSLVSEADDLHTEVVSLPGVTSAQLDYNEPVTLDSGKLQLKVEMSEDATPEQMVAVTQSAYRAFSSTHRGEEADLSIRAGDTTVALRSFEPEASLTAVDEAVDTGMRARPADGSVTIDLTTDGVPEGDHVGGTYLVTLPEGSIFTEVPELLASLAGDRPEDGQIGWGAAATDGSSLGYDSGSPPAELIGRWEGMQGAELPLTVGAFEDGVLIVEGRLTRRYDVDDPADRRALDQITHPQLRVLGDGEWTYSVRGPEGAYLADIDRFVCVPATGGPYDDELEAWAADEFGPCKPS